MMDKTIIRRAKGKANPYALLSRKTIQNPALSWKAKGMLCYLLSLPDNWHIYIKELPNHCKDGIKSTRRAFKELQDLGHITSHKRRNEKGQYLGFEYLIDEVPLKVIEPAKTLVNKGFHPRAQKRHAVNGNLLNKDLTSKENQSILIPDDTDELLDAIDKQDRIKELHWQAEQQMAAKDLHAKARI